MAKKPVKKKKKIATPKPKKPRKDPRIEEIYETTITFNCPTRGLVTQKVKVKKFKSLGEQASQGLLLGGDEIDKLEEKDNGLSMYDDEPAGEE